MNKYKKIFSGLGLLSISTLIGASVVACAKNPSPKDSNTEAIDQNNNQGNSTAPEQGKPEMPQNPVPGTDHNNQEKPETPKEGTPAPDAPSAPTPEMPKDTPEQSGNTGQSNDSKGNTQDQNKGEAGMNNSNHENNNEMTPKVTVEAKSMELLLSVEKLPYPQKDAPAKETLKNEIKTISKKSDTTEDKKLEELSDLNKKLIQIKEELDKTISKIDSLPYPNSEKNDIPLAKDYLKSKLNSLTTIEQIKGTIPSDLEEKVKKYNEILKLGFGLFEKFPEKNKKGLNARLARLYGDDHNANYTEGELIWQIYETVRQQGFVAKIKEIEKDILKQKEYIENKEVKQIPVSMKLKPGITIDQLKQKIEKMVELVKKAKEESKKNSDANTQSNSKTMTAQPNSQQ
uniref:HapA protein n=1 Tax=Mycoplasmopsis cynos TaxID=171284 RepID=A0A0A7KMV4_9BACT|nr:hemagglutinin A [Mycoplasmopsis cynos]